MGRVINVHTVISGWDAVVHKQRSVFVAHMKNPTFCLKLKVQTAHGRGYTTKQDSSSSGLLCCQSRVVEMIKYDSKEDALITSAMFV